MRPSSSASEANRQERNSQTSSRVGSPSVPLGTSPGPGAGPNTLVHVIRVGSARVVPCVALVASPIETTPGTRHLIGAGRDDVALGRRNTRTNLTAHLGGPQRARVRNEHPMFIARGRSTHYAQRRMRRRVRGSRQRPLRPGRSTFQIRPRRCQAPRRSQPSRNRTSCRR